MFLIFRVLSEIMLDLGDSMVNITVEYFYWRLPERYEGEKLELLASWHDDLKAEIERRANDRNQSYVNCQGQGAPAAQK